MLQQFINDIRPFLETLYFLASIGLVATVIIGLRQLRLLKEDIKIKNKRASVEKSIEYLNWFATDFIPKYSQYITSASEQNVSLYTGPFNDKFIFDLHCNPTNQSIVDCLAFGGQNGAVHLLNQLEYFSAAYLSGLADEELAFNPLSPTFCKAVERFYPTLCGYREDESSTFYTHTIGLYKIWKSRLEKLNLEHKRSKLDQSISQIPEQRIKYIGEN